MKKPILLFLLALVAIACNAMTLTVSPVSQLGVILGSIVLIILLIASSLAVKAEKKRAAFFITGALMILTAIMASQFLLSEVFAMVMTLVLFIISIFITVAVFTWNRKNYKGLSVAYFVTLLTFLLLYL